jgi:hypothetical protein
MWGAPMPDKLDQKIGASIYDTLLQELGGIEIYAAYTHAKDVNWENCPIPSLPAAVANERPLFGIVNASYFGYKALPQTKIAREVNGQMIWSNVTVSPEDQAALKYFTAWRQSLLDDLNARGL